MQVNTDFYGEPDTWIRNTTIDSIANTPEMYWFKVADINPDSASAFNRKSRLIDYINDDKIEFGEDIDPSICFAAMSGGPLVNVEMYNGVYDINNVQSIRTTSGMFDSPCGWFFATLTDVAPSGGTGFPGASYLTDTDYGYFDIIGKHYWKVDNRSITYVMANNVSASLQPIVEFNPRGLYMAIMITIFNKTTGSFTNYTMDQVRTNFANNTFDVNVHVIIRAYAEIYSRRGNTEAYYAVDTSGAYGLTAVPINHAIIKNEDAEHDVINYGYRNNQFTLMGWNGSNPSAFKFNHEGDTASLDDGNYYPFQRCFSVTPPGDVNNAASTMGYIWVNTQYNRFFQEARYYNQGLGIVTYIEYNSENMEEIRKAAASFGLFFTEKAGSYFSTNPDKWTDIDMFCGVLDNNGIGYGEYTRGTQNRNNAIYNYTSSQESPYTPGGGGGTDPNTYSLTTGFNSLSGGASATQRYVLNDSNVRQLLTDLWTITHTIADVDYDKFDYKILDSFLVTDPINSIVSLKRYPFNIPHTFSPNKTHVNLGKNQGEALGYLTYNVFNSVQFAGVSIYPKFGKSFLDYSPYTEYELYIPFCGTVKLDPGEILDHVLSVRMQIDLISGVCIAYIMADSLVIETVTGSVAADMQVAGTDAATADAAIQNAVINHTTARTNKEVAMVTPYTPGGIMGELSNPSKQAGAIENAKTNLEKANYDITHINTPVHTMGTAGGLSSWIQEFNCRLMIYYPEGDAIDSSGGVSATSPKLANLTEYGHTTGFYCVIQGTVSNFSGYTLGNIDTDSIAGATAEEREQIKSAFAQGVWLPMPAEE